MPTPAERQALLFVAAVAVLGVGVRGCRALRAPAPDRDARTALAEQLSAVDSAIASGGRRGTAPGDRTVRSEGKRVRESPRAKARPGDAAANRPTPSPPALIDVDRATADELDDLPGIGPALAARIVEDRLRHGPFGSLGALEEVRGIGPALASRLAPRVTFSAPPRPPRTEVPDGRRRHP